MDDPIFADAIVPDPLDRKLRDDEIDEDFLEALDAAGLPLPACRAGGNGGSHPETRPVAEILALDTMQPRAATELVADNSPEPESIIERIFLWATVLVIAGLPKVGKTWLAIMLALALASGQPFLGFPTLRRRRVLYLGGEGNDRQIRKRILAAIAAFPGLQDEDLEGLRILSTLGRVKLDDPRHEEAVLRWAEDADVIIVDPLFRFQGHGDENSHSDARGLQDAMDRLKAAGKSIVVLHHLRKPGVSDAGVSELRGAGLDAFADSILVLSRKRQDAGNRFLLRFTLRHDEEPEDLEMVREGPLFTVADVGRRIVMPDDVVAVLQDAGGRIEGRAALLEALARRTGCTVASSVPKEAILAAESKGLIFSTTRAGTRGRGRIYVLKGGLE